MQMIAKDCLNLASLLTQNPTLFQTLGESWIQTNGSGKKKNFFDNINNLLPLHSNTDNRKLHISFPLEDFRQVSSIIDVDIVPETCRRVRLVKHGSDKPLGFYIRDGTSVRVTVSGLEKVPGIFISRLVPGGLAESTGLLSVNDEVLEVNGIEVLGKSLDQVTDMMVANSSNLIITIRPANQRNPFQYPKLPQQQSFNSIQQQPLQSGSNHRNDHRNDHRISSNNHSAPGSSKQPPGDVKHKTAISQQTASSQQQTNQRIPRNNTDNTPASTHKSSQFYLGAENHDKVPSLRTSLSAGCLGAANLAEGEDTSDEEDEVKHHFQPNDLNKNDFNKNGDGASKTLVQASRSNH